MIALWMITVIAVSSLLILSRMRMEAGKLKNSWEFPYNHSVPTVLRANDYVAIFIYALWSFSIRCDPFNHASNRVIMAVPLNFENQDRHRNACENTQEAHCLGLSALPVPFSALAYETISLL